MVSQRSAGNRETVVGVFHTQAEAQAAVRDLKAAGFTDGQIGIAAQDREGSYSNQTSGTMAEEGAVAGAATGLGAGALWGLGIVAGVLPAIGPVIAGGALAAIAASAAGTAIAGGLVGGLIGLGLPEEEADYYHREFESGRTIVTVRAGQDWERAVRILDAANSYDYDRRESDFAANAAATERLDYNGNLVPRRDLSQTSRRL